MATANGEVTSTVNNFGMRPTAAPAADRRTGVELNLSGKALFKNTFTYNVHTKHFLYPTDLDGCFDKASFLHINYYSLLLTFR